MFAIFDAKFWTNFVQKIGDNALQSMLHVVGVLLAYLFLRKVLYSLIDGVLNRLIARETRHREMRPRETHHASQEDHAGRLQTLQGLFKSVVGYVLFFVFGTLFLKAVGFDILPFITTASVIGFAIGFGSQKLVKDVISGFFIIVDDLFVVGEMVTIGTITGQVQEMGMRVTRLLDTTGKTHLLANGDIGTVTNLSRHPVADFIEIAVAATADLNKTIKTINATGETLFAQEDHPLKVAPRVLGITAFTAAAVTVRVTIVSDPHDLSDEQMRVRAAMREALITAGVPFA